jgi:hypothetical protein
MLDCSEGIENYRKKYAMVELLIIGHWKKFRTIVELLIKIKA